MSHLTPQTSSQHHLHSQQHPLSPNSLKQIQPEPITLEDLEKSISNSNPNSISLTPSDSGLPYGSKHQYPTLRKIVHYLEKTQKYTGYLFTTFVGLHILSVIIAPGLGVPLSASQDLFELGRAIYQQIPGMEFILVTGCSIAHIASGVGKRLIQSYIRNQRRGGAVLKLKLGNNDMPIFDDLERDDIGFGGITGLIGLGYRKSWISRLTPNLTPLTFSGYVLIPVLAYHFIKFRWSPVQVDGDSSLISLQYISHILHFDEVFPKYQKLLNFAGIVFLVWVGLYHMIGGLWKIRRRYSARDKKLGYIIINGLTLLSVISLLRFRRMSLDTGFLAKLFTKYIKHFLW